MPLTDKLCFGITILFILLYVALAAFAELQIPYLTIGKPHKGVLCNDKLISLNDSFMISCVDNCQNNQVIKRQSLHQHLSHQNQQQFITYNEKICLPTQNQQFQAVAPYTRAPWYIYVSQSLQRDIVVPVFAIFFTLSVVYIIISFYPSYSEIIIKSLNNSYLISLLVILAIIFNKLTQIEEAQQILTSNDSKYDSFQMTAIFRLQTLQLPYWILLGFIALLLVMSTIDFSIHTLNFSVFPLSHWFSMKYYEEHFGKRQSWVLVLAQILNFAIFYVALMHSLSLTKDSQDNIYGSLSGLSFIILAVATILFIYFTIILCVLSEYSLYGDNFSYCNYFGTAAKQAGLLIVYSFPLLINIMISYCSKQRADQNNLNWQHLTSLKIGEEIIQSNQQENTYLARVDDALREIRFKICIKIMHFRFHFKYILEQMLIKHNYNNSCSTTDIL